MNMSESLRGRLLSKELTIGSWISWGYPLTCEIMARSGFDWLVVDMEHGPIGVAEAQSLIQIIDLAGCVPLVRVAQNHATPIKQALDAGAHGVVVPLVNSAAEARAAVSSALYPPAGTRGVGLARAQQYGMAFEEYRARAAEETVVVVQIEHIAAVEQLEAIIEVEGVDGFIVGPYDLSGSLGLPGQFDHPRVQEAMQEIGRVVRTTEKVSGHHVVHSDPLLLQAKIDEGYNFLAYGDDMVFFAEKAAEAHRTVQMARGSSR